MFGIGMMAFADFGKFHYAGLAISFSLIVGLLAVLTLGTSLLRPTLMGVVDTTIVGVARPYIAGGLSAPAADDEWVMTSYLAAHAFILPLARATARHQRDLLVQVGHLGSSYFQVVFTLPDVLQPLMLHNQRRLYTLSGQHPYRSVNLFQSTRLYSGLDFGLQMSCRSTKHEYRGHYFTRPILRHCRTSEIDAFSRSSSPRSPALP